MIKNEMVKRKLNSKSTLDQWSVLRSKETLMEEIFSRANMFEALDKAIINGWYEYFKLQTDKTLFRKLDSWIRRRLRAYCFRALGNGKRRLKEFLKCRMDYDTAYRLAYTQSGPWRTSKGQGMQTLLNNKRLKTMGLISLER